MKASQWEGELAMSSISLVGVVQTAVDAACHRIITDIRFCKHWSTVTDSYRFFKDDQSVHRRLLQQNTD